MQYGNYKKIEIKALKWLMLSASAILVVIFSGFGEESDIAVSVTETATSYESPFEVETVVEQGTTGEEDTTGVASIQSFTFSEDLSIRQCLTVLGSRFRKNIIPSENIEGLVTSTTLYDVTFKEALQAVIGPNKFEIEEGGDFVRVYTPEDFQTRLKHSVIKLYYITAAEAEKLIAPLLSEYGTVASTTPALLDTEPGKGGDTLSLCDRLVIKDYPDNIKDIEDAIKEIDQMPPQVLIEVTILEAELDETTQFGIDFDVLGLTTATAGTVALGDDALKVSSLASSVAPLTQAGLSVGIVQSKVRMFIRALEEVTDTTILANPKILALNKQAGKLLIGDEDGYLTTTVVSDGGTATQQVAFLETGTKLQFRPYICKDGMIRMEISPEQSTGGISASTDLPEKKTTTVQTNIMVEDGKTIVIGGLFQEKTALIRSQVPVLGDIPFLGELFRKTNDQSVRTELIVLITPHIITSPEDTDGDQRLADVNRLVHKARKNITWLSRTRRAEDRYDEAVRRYHAGDPEGALSQLNWIFERTRNYLEIERLRDRIIMEKYPDYTDHIERIMIAQFEKEESAMWYRQLKADINVRTNN